MRVFVAGASGVIGRALLPRLIKGGHTVTAMTRSPERAAKLAEVGAEPVVCDVYDADGLAAAVQRAAPDLLVHQLTALPRAVDPRKIDEQLAANDRIRVEGTGNLVAAAQRGGVRRLVAQSIAFAYAPTGGPVKGEDDPLWLDAPGPWRRTVAAVADLEHLVTASDGIEGVALRYGYFYGPGTSYASDGVIAEAARGRRLPIAGAGAGVFSFIHVDDAAAATVAAIERGATGVYNIVDDAPLLLRDWLPLYARALGAPAPRKVPALLVRLMAGRHGHYLMTQQRGASNARAKQELGWSPQFATLQAGLSAG